MIMRVDAVVASVRTADGPGRGMHALRAGTAIASDRAMNLLLTDSSLWLSTPCTCGAVANGERRQLCYT
jgi:hypothetical protein